MQSSGHLDRAFRLTKLSSTEDRENARYWGACASRGPNCLGNLIKLKWLPDHEQQWSTTSSIIVLCGAQEATKRGMKS